MGAASDYGNGETDSLTTQRHHGSALFGGASLGHRVSGGHNNGPWIMADLENGLFAGWKTTKTRIFDQPRPSDFPFVTAMLVAKRRAERGKGRFALYAAMRRRYLKTLYDGIRPAKTGYVPMRKQGSVILGIGGDNSAG